MYTVHQPNSGDSSPTEAEGSEQTVHPPNAQQTQVAPPTAGNASLKIRETQRDTPTRIERATTNKKTVKASLKIATLNMNGFRKNAVGATSDKWMHINQFTRDHKVGILAVQ